MGALTLVAVLSLFVVASWFSPAFEQQRTKRRGVTLAQYSKIETGMTYAQVVAFLGEPKAELSRSSIAGFETVMYEWQGTTLLGNMNAMFQNGKLVQKAQFGLE